MNNNQNGQQFNFNQMNNNQNEQQFNFNQMNNNQNGQQFNFNQLNNQNGQQFNFNQMNNNQNGQQFNFNQSGNQINNFPQQNISFQNFINQNNLCSNDNIQNFVNNNSNINNNNSNNNDYPNEIKLLTQHTTGIQNIGQTCYMNATIQVLSNIIMLSKNLLKKYMQKTFDIENQTLSAAFSSLLYELYFPQKDQKYISPKIFKEIIGELNPLFKGMQAADAKDLIFFIIERMHQELNPIKQQKNYNIDFSQQEINSRNPELMLSLFINDFQMKNKTIISDIFYGITQSKMECNKCNTIKYSYQSFNLLIFQLKKVKEMTKKRKNINLYDAFEVDKREELLEGENNIFCNNCHCLTNGKHQQQIYSLPKVLIIILNRGKNNKDFNEKFDFPPILDFSENKGIIIRQDFNQIFYLSGIITHLGESGNEGHFIAYCKSEFDSQFYCYNDASVTLAKEEDAIKTVISSRDYDKKTPYILIYHCF